MKRSTHSIAALAARTAVMALTAFGALSLAGCSQEEQAVPVGQGQRLSISICDDGYAPADDVRPALSGGCGSLAADPAGSLATRATENGYATGFTPGDACGLSIVRDGEVVAANVRLTASAGAGGTNELVWTPDPAAGELWYASGDCYFLYYPWQAAPQGAPTVGDSFAPSVPGDAGAEFFAALIAAWTPAANQSDYPAGYTASDLMTAEASVGSASGGVVPLTFSMTHRMALAVVEFPRTVYKFDNGDTMIPDYAVAASGIAFSGAAQPLATDGSTYRYLVNPALAAAPILAGGYGGNREFTIAPTGLEAGSYKVYKVDGGRVEKNHTLQVGDYFLADGNLLSKDAAAEMVAQAEVAGIVFQTAPSRIGEGEKNALGGEAHGLVLAAKNAATNVQWGPYGTDIPDLPNITTVAACYGDIDGYSNTHTVWAFDGYTANPADYPAFRAVADFNTTHAAPGNTTGWFMPSAGQLWDVLEHLGGVKALADQRTNGDQEWYGTDPGNDICASLNRWLAHVTDAAKFGDSYNWFWSSSECSGLDARSWVVGSDGYVFCLWDRKRIDYDVRPVLAF